MYVVGNYYFSDQNVIFTNKSRASYSVSLNYNIDNLPVLKNDTNDRVINGGIFYNKVNASESYEKNETWSVPIKNQIGDCSI